MALESDRSVAPPTPGAVLRTLLLSDGRVTQDALAEAMGVSRFSVNQLVNDRRGVTAEMALRLGKATGTTPEFWLDLQRRVDLDEAYRRIGHELERVTRVVEATPESEIFYEVTD